MNDGDMPVHRPDGEGYAWDGVGARSMLITSYDLPKFFYSEMRGTAAKRAGNLGALLWYADKLGYVRKGRGFRVREIEIDSFAEKWKDLIVGLATAHDKDDADRYEARVEECLSPILAMPIRQVRKLADKILEVLQTDKAVPYVIWRAFEVWVVQMRKAPDDGVKELKAELAREIAEMVEGDMKEQILDATVRALQWRSPEKLEEVRNVVAQEKAAGRKVRLKGRESCLFLEAGGTEDEPKVCVQV